MFLGEQGKDAEDEGDQGGKEEGNVGDEAEMVELRVEANEGREEGDGRD